MVCVKEVCWAAWLQSLRILKVDLGNEISVRDRHVEGIPLTHQETIYSNLQTRSLYQIAYTPVRNNTISLMRLVNI